MPKVTKEHLEARRRQILDAAFACFSRHGFHQTTMQDICRESGLSPGAVYRYFSSKEEIIEASCLQCQQEMAALSDLASNGHDTLATLDRIADFGFGSLEDAEAQATVRVHVQLWAEALGNPKVRQALAANVEGLRGVFVAILSQAHDRGEVDPALDTQSLARALVSLWQGMILQKSLDPNIDVSGYLKVVKTLYRGTFRKEP